MSAVPQLFDSGSNDAKEAILSKVNEIAVLPHAVYRILELSGSDVAASELEKAIAVDPGFSAKLLAHANCAFYGLPKRVTSIKEGIMFLGFKAIRQMAMTVGVFDLFAGKTDRESLRRREWWRASIDAGIYSKWLSKQSGLTGGDEAFTIGLIHLIGKTIMDRSQAGAYDEVEDLVASGASVIGAEQQIFGCTHIEISAGACRRWGLPNQIVDSFDYIQAPAADCATAPFRATLALAKYLAIAARTDEPGPAPEWALTCLGFPIGCEAELSQRSEELLADTGSLMG